MAVASLKIVVGIKVGGGSESAGADLSFPLLQHFQNHPLLIWIILRVAIAFQSQRKCFTKLQTSHSKKLILALGQL